MDHYVLWFLILIIVFLVIVYLKNSNYLKESFEGDTASSVSSTASTNASTNASSLATNVTPIAANTTTPVTPAAVTIQSTPQPANASTPVAAAVTTKTADKPVTEEKKEENKEEDVEGTPAQMGLIFGYLPDSATATDELESLKNPNTIYSRDSINIFSGNNYLGYSNKNPLFPNFLEKLGTFNPYIYQTIKIHIKNNLFKKLDVLADISTNEIAPIIYSESIVCFTIKYLQDTYFLQYVANTNTFYLTDTPSFFILLKASDSTNNKPALYGDNIILKCLENSQYVLLYDKIMVTEPDRSTSFVIKRGEIKDICVNFYNDKDVDMTKFLPQYLLDPVKEKELRDKYSEEIKIYVDKLKKSTNDKIQLIQDNITVLEGKLNNTNTMLDIQIQNKKIEYKQQLDAMKLKLKNDIDAYKTQKEQEYNEAKKKIETDKTAKWEADLSALKNSIRLSCNK